MAGWFSGLRRIFGGGTSDTEAEPEGLLVVARLNARVQPLDRYEYFEEPLSAFLKSAGLGRMTGGGTQLVGEPDGIAYCEIEMALSDDGPEAITALVRQLEETGAPMGSTLIREGAPDLPFGMLEGLGLYINGRDLADEVYATSDINHVIEECSRLIPDEAPILGHWEGSTETALYFYGRSFAEMSAAIAPFVESYPLCEKARLEQIA
ncbi:MAG: hypothetical protein AAFY59_03580 [Pseudomonadota bacterium]